MPNQTASVIVCTYNAERQLDLVLSGLARQTEKPLEVLIADDGSKETTKSLVSDWKTKIPGPLKHIWHEDQGNQKAVIVNKTVVASAGSQLLFLDGDCIPHPKWVSDHLRAANSVPEAVWCGRRCRLGPEVT
ncbi:MAG: glycosyltransferase, partial [Planctomycetota bacterium]|nr:glycosyltransferase [Planctomycetota bacterium]